MEAFELLNYLKRRILKDEEFFLSHQNELQIDDPQQKEIYDVTQGKVDLCRYILQALEQVRQHPEVIRENC
ncbi:hypothetical protein CSA56_09390 [candidate division KSB3 bacterium]|uniref:Uncharacterized protein n=1 Tax=candidate division KSB3 bacterium TaxID=2044937 RepID=A0A2G6KFY0_9BACT|nr:MAG: hypothetical protein CSA56_09390 [candidate division KSB3 bacterium]